MKDQKNLEQAASLEREAYRLHAEQKIEEAFNAYDEAGSLYRNLGEPLKAAVCFASAATCWNIRTGIQPLRNAATRSAFAAREAMKGGQYDYARSLFHDAAMLFEREGDFESYSTCFWESQLADAKRAWTIFMQGIHKETLENPEIEVEWHGRLQALGHWILNTGARFLWGYGERPLRTIGVAVLIVLASAFIYSSSGLIDVGGEVSSISFLEGLYLSMITFATVGYGDYLPVGWTRSFAVLEGLSGVLLVPLFLVALTRKYLRLYR